MRPKPKMVAKHDQGSLPLQHLRHEETRGSAGGIVIGARIGQARRIREVGNHRDDGNAAMERLIDSDVDGVVLLRVDNDGIVFRRPDLFRE